MNLRRLGRNGAIISVAFALFSCAVETDVPPIAEETGKISSAIPAPVSVYVIAAANPAGSNATTPIERDAYATTDRYWGLSLAEMSTYGYGPGVVSNAAHQMEAFFVDVNGDVKHLYTDSCSTACWRGDFGEDNWGQPGGWPIVGAPAAITAAPGSVDVFVQVWSPPSGDPLLYWRHWDPNSNPGWKAVTWLPTEPGTPPGALAGSSWGSGRIDLFRSRSNQIPNSILHLYIIPPGNHYSGYQGMETWYPPDGVTLLGDAAAASRYSDNLNVVVRTTSGHIWGASMDRGNDGWYDWGWLGTPCASGNPWNLAIVVPPNTTDLSVGATCIGGSPQTTNLSMVYYDAVGGGWGSWTDVGQIGQSNGSAAFGLGAWYHQ